MADDQENGNESFTDFASFESVRVTQQRPHGSVLKAASVQSKGERRIEVEATASDVPGIILHRSGDLIERVEIVCPCGRHSEIALEYDTE